MSPIYLGHLYILVESILTSITIVINHLGGGPMIKACDQEVCSLCGLRFEPCGCSYDSHWRLTWSLTSGPIGLVEMHTSWPDTHVKLKKQKLQLLFLSSTAIKDPPISQVNMAPFFFIVIDLTRVRFGFKTGSSGFRVDLWANKFILYFIF